MKRMESFLRRWSRLKQEAPPKSAPIPPAAAALPQVDTLELDSDFSPFLASEVDSNTRLKALKKLFMQDHYRVMDGLDVYVEDYSRPAVLPPELLATLNHAQAMLQRETEGEDKPLSAVAADTHLKAADPGEVKPS